MEIKFLNISLKKRNKYIVKNLNLQIKSSLITGIYQDNINLIPNLLISNTEYKGTILFDNCIKETYEKNLISYIGKINNKTFLTKKVSDEFYLIKNKINISGSSYIKKITSALGMVGLEEKYLEREICTLSKSEKRLVQIAISLIINPDIIIIDEPFLYLDKLSCFNIKKILHDLKTKYKKTIIVLSQDINVLYEICNNLVIFKDNKILISDSISSIFKNLNYLKENKINLPNFIIFNQLALKYNKKLNNHKDIKDLIKDVYKKCSQK